MKPPLKLALDALARVVFAVYGAWCWLRGPRPLLPLTGQDVQRILVIRLDLLGDAVFTIPAIRALAAAFPAATIDVLALPYPAPLLRMLPEVRSVHELDVNAYRRPSGLLRLPTLAGAIRQLRAQEYDLALGSRLSGGVFAALSGAHWRAGYAEESYWGCYNLPVPGHRYLLPQHEVDYCLDIVRALGIQPAAALRAPALPRPNGRPAAFEKELERPYAVIVPGASNGSAKRWPAPYWATLADRLGGELGLRVVLCGSESERGLAGEVTRAMQTRPVDLVGRTSVDELTAVLAHAEIVLAGDTGPLHVAAALGRSVVGIYGPTDPGNTGPLAEVSRTLRSGLPCSPCYDLRSPADCKLPDRSIACMWKVEPARVFRAVSDLLSAGPTAKGES